MLWAKVMIFKAAMKIELCHVLVAIETSGVRCNA